MAQQQRVVAISKDSLYNRIYQVMHKFTVDELAQNTTTQNFNLDTLRIEKVDTLSSYMKTKFNLEKRKVLLQITDSLMKELEMTTLNSKEKTETDLLNTYLAEKRDYQAGIDSCQKLLSDSVRTKAIFICYEVIYSVTISLKDDKTQSHTYRMWPAFFNKELDLIKNSNQILE